MVKVKKQFNNRTHTATIKECHQAKYIALGWVVVPFDEEVPFTEEADIIAKGIDDYKAARERGNSRTSKVQEANAIAATELRKPRKNKFTDGLLED